MFTQSVASNYKQASLQMNTATKAAQVEENITFNMKKRLSIKQKGEVKQYCENKEINPLSVL